MSWQECCPSSPPIRRSDDRGWPPSRGVRTEDHVKGVFLDILAPTTPLRGLVGTIYLARGGFHFLLYHWSLPTPSWLVLVALHSYGTDDAIGNLPSPQRRLALMYSVVWV
jgi:hypothetical protein